MISGYLFVFVSKEIGELVVPILTPDVHIANYITLICKFHHQEELEDLAVSNIRCRGPTSYLYIPFTSLPGNNFPTNIHNTRAPSRPPQPLRSHPNQEWRWKHVFDRKPNQHSCLQLYRLYPRRQSYSQASANVATLNVWQGDRNGGCRCFRRGVAPDSLGGALMVVMGGGTIGR